MNERAEGLDLDATIGYYFIYHSLHSLFIIGSNDSTPLFLKWGAKDKLARSTGFALGPVELEMQRLSEHLGQLQLALAAFSLLLPFNVICHPSHT